jgi:hypothetical protein
MKQIIYANKQHQVLLENYIIMLLEFVKDVANETRYKNYIEVFNIIIDYHNTYGNNRTSGNWHDWLMILPINLSVMTTGFLAGIETKRNAAIIKSYRVLSSELVHDLVDSLSELKTDNE